jgi:hypothetical protein
VVECDRVSVGWRVCCGMRSLRDVSPSQSKPTQMPEMYDSATIRSMREVLG